MIVRAIAIQNATDTGIATTCGAGAAYDLGSNEDGQSVFAGLHILSTAAGANTVAVKIFSGSSSGFGLGNAGTCRFAFTAVACRFAEWGPPVTAIFATCQRFWRAEWATSCTGRKLLAWMSRSCG